MNVDLSGLSDEQLTAALDSATVRADAVADNLALLLKEFDDRNLGG